MTVKDKYDLVVIGAGPGGYVAAARAAQLGMKTACIEKDDRMGGVCLNCGCIPSKALLDSSGKYSGAKNSFAGHGIKIKGVDLDLAAMMARKDAVVTGLTQNVRTMLNGLGVTIIHGTARLKSGLKVEVVMNPESPGAKAQKKLITADRILIATGSAPAEVEGIPFDGKKIVDSTGALSFDRVPGSLAVVGGGYIGLELGSVWARLGSRVTVLEMLPQIAGAMDGQVSRTLMRSLAKQGIEFMLNTRVSKVEVKRTKVWVTAQNRAGESTIKCDRVLVAVGRRPLTKEIGLDHAGIKLGGDGRIIVDETFQTSAKGIYAIGDIIAGPMLAHKASAEARAAVECMAGLPGEVNYDAIVSVVYTKPEAASVGPTEEALRKKKVDFCKGVYPFSASGRARCAGDLDGFVKVLSHKKTGRLLGVHIIGPSASEMIAEAVFAVNMGAAAEDIGLTVHGHPTFGEALQEAAMAARD
ncbi:MAG: dihydrolipoyl dehydrogenase [Deltaproteobacteria bacterium]|nr:dihydrolipoyl dehydrogenase [Deltaproteobacteria bacterium]